MSLTGTHQTGDPGHVADHNAIDQALIANLGMPKALGGATALTRYVGGTTTGAPTAGTFAVGDFVVSQDAHVWVCTAAGSPGTWSDIATAGVTSALNARAQVQPLKSGYYYYTMPPASGGTSNTIGNGAMRVGPWWVPSAVTLTRIGLEVTAAGNAGSVVRPGIYADDGTGYPGACVLDAGTIDGTVVGVAELTVSVTLQPGLYWTGAAVQNAATTQPTIRTAASSPFPHVFRIGTTIPPTNQNVLGYADFTASGALGAFATTVTAGATVPRIFVKTA